MPQLRLAFWPLRVMSPATTILPTPLMKRPYSLLPPVPLIDKAPLEVIEPSTML